MRVKMRTERIRNIFDGRIQSLAFGHRLESSLRVSAEYFLRYKNNIWPSLVIHFKYSREFGMDMYTLLHLKWLTNKVLQHSTWNSFQCLWQPRWEVSLGENGCVWLSPLPSTWNYHKTINWLYSNTKLKVQKIPQCMKINSFIVCNKTETDSEI